MFKKSLDDHWLRHRFALPPNFSLSFKQTDQDRDLQAHAFPFTNITTTTTTTTTTQECVDGQYWMEVTA